MKKSLFIILSLCVLILLFSCNAKDVTDGAGSSADNDITVESGSEVSEKNSKSESSDLSNDVSSEPDKGVDNMNEFVLKGIVKGYNTHLEIEVIESDYAFGIYWVIVPNSTPILDKNGSNIELSSLKEGDIVEITYNGQTMMSYPPQIVALKIVRT